MTIDDLPCVGPRNRLPKKNIELIVGHLNKAKVVATGFVCGDRGNFNAVRVWLDAKFPLGNHTYSHPQFSKLTPAAYFADIEKNEKTYLANSKVNLKNGFFRFPYLDHGNCEEKVQAMENYCKKSGYRLAHVSLDTVDYRFAQEYAKPGQNHFIPGMYAEHVEECAQHFASMSQLLFQRQIPLILLLHANELNADCLGQVLSRLSQNGWSFISLEKAIKDPIYQKYLYRPPLSECRGDRNLMNQIALSRGIRVHDVSGDRHFNEYWLPIIKARKNSN